MAPSIDRLAATLKGVKARVEQRTMTKPIEEQIQAAIDEARAICDRLGANAKECAAAWDAVEELQAEAGDQKTVTPKSNFEAYCEANPEAGECRIYED